MTFRFVDSVGGLLVLAVALLMAGCPGAGTTGGGAGKGGADAGGKGSADDLASKIGDYMPPLDGGKLEIAAPKGWDWANPGGGVLVAFKPKEAEINSLPRVLLSVADSDVAGIDNVTAENVEAFVRQVSDSLEDPKPKEPVRAVTFGKHHFARYLTFGKRRNQVVVMQSLKTISGGRVYTLRLEAYQHQFDKYKNVLSVIALSMKFAGEGPAEKPAPEAKEPPAAEPGEKPPKEARPEQPAEEKPAAEAAKKAETKPAAKTPPAQ